MLQSSAIQVDESCLFLMNLAEKKLMNIKQHFLAKIC